MPYARDLKGRIALVTGEHGRTLARSLARRGATVVVTRCDEREAEALAHCISAQSGNADVHPLALDLTSLPSVRRGAGHIIETFGQLHLLVTDTAGPHLGAFLLAHLLLDTMRHSSSGPIIRLTPASDRQQVLSVSWCRGRF
jgi:NAD(P)-dependent dehydrogenase (short-subunit alcohol dehydrogenase family)